jgi:hypothetical protein
MSKQPKALIAVSLTLQLMTSVLRFCETWVDYDQHRTGVRCTELQICPAMTPKGETVGAHNVYYVKSDAMLEMFMRLVRH